MKLKKYVVKRWVFNQLVGVHKVQALSADWATRIIQDSYDWWDRITVNRRYGGKD